MQAGEHSTCPKVLALRDDAFMLQVSKLARSSWLTCSLPLTRVHPPTLPLTPPSPEHLTISPNGDAFVKSSLATGLLPEILQELLAARKRCACVGGCVGGILRTLNLVYPAFPSR